MPLKKTPLHAQHQHLQAKMTDFSGWDMPLHYGSQIAEHEAVRSKAGMFDVSHMCPADLVGQDAKRALQYLLANDVDKLAINQALYSAMLYEHGGIVDDLIVYWLGGDHYRLVLNAGCADKDIAWIREQLAKGAFNVAFTPRRDLAMLAIQGPQARALASSIAYVKDIEDTLMAVKPFYALVDKRHPNRLLARTGYTGEDGFEWMIPAGEIEQVWQQLIAVGVMPCGLGARDTLRLEAGMSLYGQDLDAEHSPLVSGIAWTVALKTPRNFIGRHALENLPQNAPHEHLLGLKLQQPGVMRSHQILRKFGDTKQAGEITSGGFSPTMKCSIALARMDKQINIGDRVEINIRDKWLPAIVIKPPFVRNGKVLV